MDSERFLFYTPRKQEFPGFQKRETQDFLLKWSMKDGIKLQSFSFDRPYKPYLMESFVHDFFTSPTVIHGLEKINADHKFVPFGIPADRIQMKSVGCTLTTMDIFDKLSKDDNIVIRKNGIIRTCLYNPWDDDKSYPVEIGNGLRKMLVDPDKDFENPYTNEEKDEFLMRIFSHLVIGGSLCQYEDIIDPYISITKTLYKDLVSVHLETEKNGYEYPKVASHVIQILKTQCDGYGDCDLDLLFNKPHMNNFFYLIVDPFQHVVKTMYHHV